MKLAISWKVFFLLLLLLLIPVANWYALNIYQQQIEISNTETNKQLLNSYHGLLLKLIQEDSNFAEQMSLQKNAKQVVVAKREGPILVDGFADEWFPYQDNLLQTRNDTNPSQMRLIEDQQFVYGLIEVQDNHVIYLNNQNQGQSSDTLRLDLGYGYWLLQAVAPGRMNVQREFGSGLKPINSIVAVWQETKNGYVVEFRAPKLLVGDKLNAVLYDVDNQELSNYNDKYQGVFTFTNFSYLPLAREKNNAWLLANELNQKRLTITNQTGQVIYQVGDLFPINAATMPTNDRYRSVKKIDDAFTRSIYQNGSHSEDFNQGSIDFYARAGKFFQINGEQSGLVILESSLLEEKRLLGTIKWWLWAFSVLIWLLILSMVISQISKYRKRIAVLNDLTEQANEADADAVDFSNIEIDGHDEISQLYENMAYYNQRLEQRRGHQQKLLARLNHELRTPLAIIGSSIDNLALSDLDEGDQQLIDNARTGLERLSLSFSRLSEANRLEDSIDKVELEWFVLGQLLESLVTSYGHAWPDISFNLNLDDVDVKVRGTEDLFAQMLDKIISNAVDFCDDRKTIIISLELNKSSLQLSVFNYGPMIEQDKLQTVFNLMESHRKKDNAIPSSGKTSNLGLGLYLARLIARRHKAKIFATNSENNDGVSFNLLWAKKNFRLQ
ncbi:ATP-binding protein [Kangiella sp. HZ709]|uniref:ATP-binding protein n=1 Tax=Kangiella sp. HZ709 TaxID=2666328 RepID=UPI0012AFCDA7|nr:ATP-binding protein [Kangiella sp. HZ709]MRX28355.1 hypothetical protein [Kangiella sp. HZ709]